MCFDHFFFAAMSEDGNEGLDSDGERIGGREARYDEDIGIIYIRFKDEIEVSEIQCYGDKTNQNCIMQPCQTLNRSLVHQSLNQILPLQSICDIINDEGEDRNHGVIDIVMVYVTTRIIMSEDGNGGLDSGGEGIGDREARYDEDIGIICIRFKDGIEISEIQCYGDKTNQNCIMQPCQTLNRSLVHQSLNQILPLQSICDIINVGGEDRKHGVIDIVMVYVTTRIIMSEDGNGGLDSGGEGIGDREARYDED
eukprot:841100_1